MDIHWDWNYLIIIIFGAIPCRGATYLMSVATPLELPLWANTKNGMKFIIYSNFFILFLAFVNGYLYDGFSGLIIIGILTIPATTLANIFLRFNPILQFIFFGPAYLMFTLYLIIR